jgi:tetratricopeptide (TPR) repeat protein
MACKEVMVTAPLIVLLYDRTFLAGSFAAVLRRRWGLYLGLAVTWVLLAYLVLSTGLIFRQSEMGAPDAWSYARTQPEVILHYLRLSVWPHPLCLGYDWPLASSAGEILPGVIATGLLLVATVWALRSRKTWGFLGAWFFLILAPTSSIFPLSELAFEHRMYLSLAAMAVPWVSGGYILWEKLHRWSADQRADQRGQSPFSPQMTPGKVGLWAAKKGTVPGLTTVVCWAAPVVTLAAMLAALGCTTVARNSDYRSLLTIWQDAVDKRPNNPLGHNNLGLALADLGKTEEAIEHYHHALRLKPDSAVVHYNLGNALAATGRFPPAIEHYEQALRRKSDFAAAHNNLAAALVRVGRTAEAIKHWEESLRRKPDYAAAHYNLASLLAGIGRTGEAIQRYQTALRLRPDYVDAHINLANVLFQVGRLPEAIAHYREVLRLTPDSPEAHYNLANALIKATRTSEAIEQFQETLRLKPDYADAHNNLGLALAGIGKTDEAVAHYRQAVRWKPGFAAAYFNLATILAAIGRTKEAIEHYHQFLQLMPDSVNALNNLAWLLATREPAEGGDPDRAVRLAQRARELSGQENAQCLDTLAAAYAAASRFEDAVLTAERAVQLAASAGETTLMKNIQRRLELYRSGRAYREIPRPPAQTGP